MKFNYLVIICLSILFYSCSEEPENKPQKAEQINPTVIGNQRYMAILEDYSNAKKTDSLDGTVAVIQVNNQTWMKYNLDVKTFINGDQLKHAQSEADWRECCDKNIPAWCYIHYYNNEFKEAFGLMYNEAAINDSRGLFDSNWRLPRQDDWDSLLINYPYAPCNLKSKVGWDDEALKLCNLNPAEPNQGTTNFYLYPTGYRLSAGMFASTFGWAVLWSTDVNGQNATFVLDDKKANISFVGGDQYKGCAIRCIRNN